MQKARRQLSPPTACRRTVSGTISLCCSQYFSPFPYGTGSLSVTNEYLALPDGTGSFTQDFSGPALLRILLVQNLYTYRAFTLSRLPFQVVQLPFLSKCSPTTPVQHAVPVWALPLSLATT